MIAVDREKKTITVENRGDNWKPPFWAAFFIKLRTNGALLFGESHKIPAWERYRQYSEPKTHVCKTPMR